jgi:hypothetical protein
LVLPEPLLPTKQFILEENFRRDSSKFLKDTKESELRCIYKLISVKIRLILDL